MIKPKSRYLVLTPVGNNSLIIAGKHEDTKYTREVLDGKVLQEKLQKYSPMQIEHMELYEIKQQLFMQPVTTITISAGETNGKSKK